MASTWIWALIRYRFISIFLASLGALFVNLKWISSIAVAIYFISKSNYILAFISGLWPIITLLLMLISPPSLNGVLQKKFMNELGYEEF